MSIKVLTRVLHFVLYGWLQTTQILSFLSFYNKRDELTVEGTVHLWGEWVITLQKYLQFILNELHTGHLGIVRMKALASMHVFQPGLDDQIEKLVLSCSACQTLHSVPPAAPYTCRLC